MPDNNRFTRSREPHGFWNQRWLAAARLTESAARLFFTLKAWDIVAQGKRYAAPPWVNGDDGAIP
jgi:hypothetical protein